MWYQITNLWNKGKYWIIAGAVAVLYLLGYRRGKEKEQVKVMKGTVENVKTAKQSRDSLADPKRVERLHNKYKRRFLPFIRTGLCRL